MIPAESNWLTSSLVRAAYLAHRLRLDMWPGYGEVYRALYPFYKEVADGGLLRWIRRHGTELRRGHLIDLGANLGVVSAELGRILSPEHRLLSVEPESFCFRALCHRLRNVPGSLRLEAAVGER